MQPTKNKPSVYDDVLPPVDIEHPGFFLYPRFSHGNARKRKSETKPLSQNTELAIWPTVIDSKTAGTGGVVTPVRSEKPNE